MDYPEVIRITRHWKYGDSEEIYFLDSKDTNPRYFHAYDWKKGQVVSYAHWGTRFTIQQNI